MKHAANVTGGGGTPKGTRMHTLVSHELLSRSKLEVLPGPYRPNLPLGASSFHADRAQADGGT
jgi:hypothetical protein